MKIIDVIEMRKNKNKQRQKRTRGMGGGESAGVRGVGCRSYNVRVRAKWFFCAFKLGFLQLICKASLVFKSNLELALLIILKQRELFESKHVAVEYGCSMFDR